MEYQTKCNYCGKAYTAQRKSSRFCSDKCRKRNSRKHPNSVNIGREAYVAIDAIRLLRKPARENLLAYAVHMERLVDEMRKFQEYYLRENQ